MHFYQTLHNFITVCPSGRGLAITTPAVEAWGGYGGNGGQCCRLRRQLLWMDLGGTFDGVACVLH